jgi:hypothetical protein
MSTDGKHWSATTCAVAAYGAPGAGGAAAPSPRVLPAPPGARIAPARDISLVTGPRRDGFRFRRD